MSIAIFLRSSFFGSVFFLTAWTVGCASVVPRTYVAANEVTLPQAMKDLVCGLKTLQNESSRLDVRTGTMIDQVDIT